MSAVKAFPHEMHADDRNHHRFFDADENRPASDIRSVQVPIRRVRNALDIDGVRILREFRDQPHQAARRAAIEGDEVIEGVLLPLGPFFRTRTISGTAARRSLRAGPTTSPT